MRLGEFDFKEENRFEGWYRCDAGEAIEEVEKAALESGRLSPDHFLVCGWLSGDDHHALYLVPTGDLAEVTEGFATEMSQVMLAKVNELLPVRPYFADPSQFKFSFDGPVDRELARKILNCLQTTAVIAMCEDEIYGDGPFDEGSDPEETIIDFITEKQRVELLWGSW